jgi:hypothetical protein
MTEIVSIEDGGVSKGAPRGSILPGVFNYQTLKAQAAENTAFRVQDLVPTQSVGLLAGNPGIGKTPFAVQMGLSISAGVPFLGRETSKCAVLYCIGEGTNDDFRVLIERVARALGLTDVPATFEIYAPYWTREPAEATLAAIRAVVAQRQPEFVIIDTLRVFAPRIEEKATEAARELKALREIARTHSCGSLMVHHLRKPNYEFPADLEADPMAWFNEAAGSNALITSTDFRLGLATSPFGRCDLVFGGFVRGRGAFPPYHLVRELDPDGNPQGYQLASGITVLTMSQQYVYQQLGDTFSFTDVKRALGGGSDSNAKNHIRALELAGLVRQPEPRGRYHKTMEKAGKTNN